MIDMIGVLIFEPFPLNLCWSLSFLWPSPGQTPTKWLRISWSVARRAPYSDDVFLPSVIRGLGGLAAWLSQKPLVSELWPKKRVAECCRHIRHINHAELRSYHPASLTNAGHAGCSCRLRKGRSCKIEPWDGRQPTLMEQSNQHMATSQKNI